jgi:ribosomal protein S18 acetylase RimI-like enzyme
MTRYLEEGFSLDKLSRELKDENTAFYFVKSENEVIGYMKLNEGRAQTELQKEDSFELERIYVLSDYQGKGIGRQLLDKAIQLAKEQKASYIWLGVWEENKSAIQFYKKNGFIAFDEHYFMVGDDKQTDIMMKLIKEKSMHITDFNTLFNTANSYKLTKTNNTYSLQTDISTSYVNKR